MKIIMVKLDTNTNLIHNLKLDIHFMPRKLFPTNLTNREDAGSSPTRVFFIHTYYLDGNDFLIHIKDDWTFPIHLTVLIIPDNTFLNP